MSAFVAAFLIPGIAAKGEQAESRLSLKVDMAKKTYVAGEPVDVDFTLRNTSQEDVIILRSRTEWDFPMMVRDSRGKDANFTRYGLQLDKTRGTLVQNFQRIMLKPGEGVTGRLRANLQYDMTVEGEYRISVAYKAFAPKEWHFDEAISADVAVWIELPVIRAVSPATQPANDNGGKVRWLASIQRGLKMRGKLP